MPIFDYKCTSCENEFDKLVSISNMDLPTKEPCIKCDSLSVTKIIGRPAHFQFSDDKLKPSGEFKEILKQIKKNNVGSTIDI